MKNEKNVKDTTVKANATKKTTVPKATKASVSQMLKDMLPQLIKFGGNDLAKKVDDALKSKKSTLESLQSLLSEVITFGNTAVQPVSKKVAVENSTKPAVKKPVSTKKKAEEPKKTEEKKEEPAVEAVFQINGQIPVARMFPETLDIKNLGVLKRVDDKYKTMEEVAKALEEGKQFYFTGYWTKRHIKQYDYDACTLTKGAKEFPNDLDILEPVYYCEGIKRIWCVSLYTEGMFCFDNDTLKHIEDVNPYDNSDKFKVRINNGMEFELYELVEEPKAEKK